MFNGIKLTKDSWHRNFYEFWWSKEAPENLCNYFWALLLAVCTLFLVIGRAFYEIMKENPEDTGVITKTVLYAFNTALLGSVAVILGFAIGQAFFHPIQALAVVGGVAIGSLVIIGLGYFFFESETMKMTTTAIKAKKNKVCPRIDWS